jgi:hypothetical protein
VGVDAKLAPVISIFTLKTDYVVDTITTAVSAGVFMQAIYATRCLGAVLPRVAGLNESKCCF